MRSIFHRVRQGGWTLAALLAFAAPASAFQFVGDLVYCDADANGVYDGTDTKLDGVEVRVTCRDTAGTICFDSTATTGVLHPSLPAADFDDKCSHAAGYSAVAGELSGRYAVEILGINGAVPGCASNRATLPFECTVTVNEATLPESCSGLVTPIVGLPADGNADGDWCDPEDGPFAEGQILGDSSSSQAACEAAPSAGPADGLHVTFHSPDRTSCSLYADFGYTPASETDLPTRTPGFWKTHPSATDEFLPIESCGRTVDDVCDAIGLLSQQGGGQNAFVRHAAAAWLNCSAFGCPDEIVDAIDAGNAACAAGERRFDYGALASLLDEYNNSGTEIPSDLDQTPADPKYCSGGSKHGGSCRNDRDRHDDRYKHDDRDKGGKHGDRFKRWHRR